jgi:hypothetical protein
VVNLTLFEAESERMRASLNPGSDRTSLESDFYERTTTPYCVCPRVAGAESDVRSLPRQRRYRIRSPIRENRIECACGFHEK